MRRNGGVNRIVMTGRCLAISRAAALAVLLALGIAAGANQWHDEADRCWNEAQRLKKEKRYREAIECLKRAVTAERRNEHPRVEELTAQLNEIGGIYDFLAEHEKSLHYYKLMQKAAHDGSDSRREALSLNSIGQIYVKLNRLDEALAAYSEAREIARQKDFADIAALVLNNAGGVYRRKGDFAVALKSYEEALEAARRGSPNNCTAILNNIGFMKYVQRDYEGALEKYAEAMDRDSSAGMTEFLSTDLSNMGAVFAAQGRYGEALTYFERALRMDMEMKNSERIAARRFKLGEIYFKLGDNAQALEQFHHSLDINLRANDKARAAYVLGFIGRVHESMGKDEEALDYYIRALSMHKDIEQEEYIGRRLSDLGLLYETRERFSEAADYLAKALMNDMLMNKKERMAGTMSSIGKVMTHMRRYDQAVSYFSQSQALYRELSDHLAVSDEMKNAGIVYYYRKEYQPAVDMLIRALDECGRVGEDNASRSEVEDEAYRWLIASYLKAGMPDRAFDVNDRWALRRAYRSLPERLPRTDGSVASLEEYRRSLNQRSAAVAWVNVSWDTPIVLAADANGVAGFELDKGSFVNEVYKRMGQEIESFMGRNTRGVVLRLRHPLRRDSYYTHFERIVHYYRYLLGKKYLSGDEAKSLSYLSGALYRFLFGSLENRLADKQELIIQPEGALSTIPFETLTMTDGRFMAERYIVRYVFSHAARFRAVSTGRDATSRSILAIQGECIVPVEMKKAESPRHLELIIQSATKKMAAGKAVVDMYGYWDMGPAGNPGWGKKDAEDITDETADAAFVSGKDATKAAIVERSRKGQMKGYRILHIASPAFVVHEAPALAAIAVTSAADDGRDCVLTQRDVSSLSIGSDLAHLADLRMPIAGFVLGEGIWRMAAAFEKAGARGMSVALWPVDPGVKSEFMKQVYRMILEKNMKPSQAIAEVRRLCIKGLFAGLGSKAGTGRRGDEDSQKYISPYAWGSVVMYAD